MNRLALVGVAAFLSACASGASEKPSECKGRMRPANPYGSVLEDPSQAAARAEHPGAAHQDPHAPPRQSSALPGPALCREARA
jgi:hypothetical protein